MENIETLLAAVAHTHGFSDDEDGVSARPKLGVESSSEIPVDLGAAELITAPPEVGGDSRTSAVVSQGPSLDVPVVVSSDRPLIGAGDKRKRGRPPKGQLSERPPPPKRKKQEEEEEDVCFICFDGGSLVLCDRKGCPKAYHPACIKRDDAFFRSKAKWNCGWHICSVCQKASYYMCYTCTYSLCKGCTKDTDYLCVRGNKGFCAICMKTIMLIENKDLSNNDSVQVDFDDKTSWEYLFKVYWICLKEKLSLTISELIHAKNPWNRAASDACKPRSNNVHRAAHDERVATSYRSSVPLELNKSQEDTSLARNDWFSTDTSDINNHTVKVNSDNLGNDLSNGMPSMNKDTNNIEDTEKPSIDKVNDGSGIEKVSCVPVIVKDRDEQRVVKDTGKPFIGKDTDEPKDKASYKRGIVKNVEWASNDLLEFIGHVKNGDTSALSQFEVQTLLLDYVKRNNLRDPRQKSQIICDNRLKNLFGKPHVGHFEMLKLLESHFLNKKDSQNYSFIPAGFVSSAAIDIEVDGNTYGSPMQNNSRKRKPRRKSEERASKINLNEYAAIDVHNINLIYLRRNLLENLIEDKDTFHDKVVGSIVRIRIPTNDKKQDVYRLVQVVGTIKVAEPYKIGDRLADNMLEVLNLNKKEVVSIDSISNSTITEDECRWFRHSIRCGVLKQLTVGEVQKKAMELRPVLYNDWLEAEILRLSHLRDRANEKGHKKEFREYVHKLQLLKSPEERQRRISEIPVIHDDPKMSSTYESDDVRSDENCEKGTEEGSVQTLGKIMQKIGSSGSHRSEENINQVSMANSGNGGQNGQAMPMPGLEASTATDSAVNLPHASNIETEKLWHYRDPNGKTQGPFAMLQLRKWSTTGLFPPDMRIWRNHEQYDSLLLVDALNRKFHGSSEVSYNHPSSELQYFVATDGSGSINETDRDSKQTEASFCNSSNVLSGNNSVSVKSENSNPSWPQGWDMQKDNNSFENVQVQSLLPSSSLEQAYIALADRGRDTQTDNQITSGLELQNQCDNQRQTGQSAEENVRRLPVDLSSIELESFSAPVPPSPVSVKKDGGLRGSNPPSPLKMTGNKHWEIQTAEKQQSVSSDAHIQNSSFLELLSPTHRSNNEDQGGHAPETKQYDLINFIEPNSGPSWTSASDPMVRGMQLPEVADEWCGYSPTPSKQSVQEWNSGIVFPSSLKPPEITSDNVVPTSNNNPLTHASPSNLPNWLAIFNEPIEFVALGEESVSDLLAEVDAMESQGGLPSPTSAMKFAKELIQDCKDDCFSSIEFSHIPDTVKSDALSSTGEIQLTCESSAPSKQVEESLIDGLNSFRRSSVHSSASSEGETNAPVYPAEGGSEFHPPAPNNTSQDMISTTMVLGTGSETNDPGWGTVQGNINLVTVQGNVNLVLGGPTQGMTNLGWGTNPGPAWGNPNVNLSPINGNTPWDSQRKYSGERFNSPREWGYQGGEPGFGRGRLPWARQPYGGSGGGYSRPTPKGQRVCKFYESGRCKKGAFCDYLHPCGLAYW